jgi:hypothetical protein
VGADPGPNHLSQFDANGLLGSTFTFTPGPVVNPGSFISGKSYKIERVGTTDFTSIGGVNVTGTIFTASFIGSDPTTGTGYASANFDTTTGAGIAAPLELMDLSIPASQIIQGNEYTILVPDSNFLKIGAVSNTVGETFVATSSGTVTAPFLVSTVDYQIISLGNTNFIPLGATSINANALTPGHSYIITSLGTTNFGFAGAPPDSTVGSTFTASNAGNGTGTVISPMFTATGAGVGTGVATIDGVGIVAPTKVCSVSFNNTQVSTHKSTLQRASVKGAANVGDVWTLTATGPLTFSVQKTTPLSLTTTSASFKKQYDDGVLSFIIDRTYLNYYVTMSSGFDSYYIQQDLNSYVDYDDLPFDLSINYDPSEFFSNLSVVTEHGDVNSLVQHPVRFDPLGVVIRDSSGNYTFKFDKIPPVFTYVEFRVEQEGQYNPWVNASIEEAAYVVVSDGISVTAGSLTIGHTYVIISVGSTDFTTIGSPNNIVGTTFVATGVGSGTGTVYTVEQVITLTGSRAF